MKTSTHLGLAFVLLGVGAACSGTSDNSFSGPINQGGAAASGGTAGFNTGGSSASGGYAGGAGLFIPDASVGGSGGGSNECTGTSSKAEKIPLDIYIMLDSSGSMTQTTSGGVAKWDAIKQALTAFLNDSESAGLGVGLQFFPLNQPGAPESCTRDSQCGAFGPCGNKLCLQATQQTGTLVRCADESDCSGWGPCQPFGICANEPTYACINIGGDCGDGAGPCVIYESTCIDATSCNVATYATPAIAIETLPGAATKLQQTLQSHEPNGMTPTAPALQGLLQYSSTFAKSNPTHKAIALLATDGLPTECSPTDISSIAGIAASGFSASPSIPTFVIGVFAPDETDAHANLNAIASAGGTSTAYIVQTNGNVAAEFLKALDAIRGQALACDYLIPEAPAGEKLDYMKVNVEFDDGTGKVQQILYVGDEASCNPTTGGWYYDVKPEAGTPTKIVVCDQTCALFAAADNGTVQVRMGCETAVGPK